MTEKTYVIEVKSVVRRTTQFFVKGETKEDAMVRFEKNHSQKNSDCESKVIGVITPL